MFQGYYKSKAKYYSDKMKRFNERNLVKLDNFNGAVRKYKKVKALYDKTAYYINKLPYGHIRNVNSLYSQIEDNLDKLYNECIIKALKSNSENKCLEKLKDVKSDLNSSYGYGFDDYISKYSESLDEVIKRYSIIYKNYKPKNYKSNLEGNKLVYTSIEELIHKDGPILEDVNGETQGATTLVEYYVKEEPLYNQIVEYVARQDNISTSKLQRQFNIGYNRAAKVIDILEERGVIGPSTGSSAPREVLISPNDSGNFISKRKIDFVSLYGTDYEAIENEKKAQEKKERDEYIKFIDSYADMAQSYFDEKGLNIKFNKSKRIDKSKLNNLLFTNTTGDDVEELVNYILSISVPNELKLLLIDYSQISLFEYNGLSNLVRPVISDYMEAKVSLEKLKTEMDSRYDLFLENRVKSIDSYNDSVDKESIMPYIVVVINELFEMLKFDNTKEIIAELLLNCKRAGIIVIGFSKFNKKNIQLMMLEDLFDVHSGYSNSYLDSDNKTETKEIDEVDNDMDGFNFERYAGKLLMANGFTKVEVTQCSSDFGVDIIAYKDDIKYAIQCKKYSSPVGIKAVQEVIGSKAMNNCHVAVVLTNNTFTKSAIELAEKNNVLLWNRDKLMELIENMNK